MRWTLSPLLLSGSALALLAMPSVAQSSNSAEIGVNAAIKRDVETRSGESGDFRDAVIREAVRLGDQIRSGEGSSLQVLLKDETTFTVGPQCELTVDRFVYDPDTDTAEMAATIARGTFRFMSGKAGNKRSSRLSLKTPVASIGVRGTVVEGAVGETAIKLMEQSGQGNNVSGTDPETASLIVLRGPGRGNRGLNKTGEIDVMSGGKTITLTRSGSAVFIPDQGIEPIGPFLLNDGMMDVFSDQLRTIPIPDEEDTDTSEETEGIGEEREEERPVIVIEDFADLNPDNGPINEPLLAPESFEWPDVGCEADFGSVESVGPTGSIERVGSASPTFVPAPPPICND